MTVRRLGAASLESLLGEWRNGGTANEDLADRLRLLMLDGRIPVGTRLPAERELASRLSVSRTTVAATYKRLREDGYVASQQGSGSEARLPRHPFARADDASSPVLDTIDLTKAAMPCAPQVGPAVLRAAEQLPRFAADWDYDAVGLPHLRQAIADRYTAQGLPTDADEILVTIGAQHAIGLLSRVLVARGDRVVIETPTYPHAQRALLEAGARFAPVSVTAETGWDAEALEHAFERTSPQLAYVMPDFHNPTGASMSPAVRERLLRAAARQGTTVLVDETTAELDIDRDGARSRFIPVSAGDTGASVVNIGSIGKTVWGGLRIGWIRADRPLIARLVAARTSLDLGTPILEQLAVAELLPELDEIIAARRVQLRRSRDRVEELLAERFPSWQVPHVPGGLAIWAGLGQPVSSALTLTARTNGLIMAAGPWFGSDGAFERFLRVPITYPVDTLERAVDRLHAAWLAIGGTRHQPRMLATTLV